METKKGIINRIISSRGFGFIKQDNGEILFFHAIGVCSPTFEELREGMPVEFTITTDMLTGKERAIGVVAV